MMKLLALYLVIINLITFGVYGLDKFKAKVHAWRISEASLILLAFAGGFIGAFLGMIIFRHKIRKTKFLALVPLASLIWIIVIVWAIRSF